MKKPTRKPYALDRAIKRMETVERLALKARAIADMPTGNPALDAAQDAAMAATDRAVAALQRLHERSPR